MQAPCVTNLVFGKTGDVYDSKGDFDFSLRDILGNLPKKQTQDATICRSVESNIYVLLSFLIDTEPTVFTTLRCIHMIQT